MPFRAGEIVTAAALNRLQPVTYFADAGSDLVGPVTNTDVPDATVTFDTQAANAVFVAQAVVDFDTVGAGTTTIGTAQCVVDGVVQSGIATFQAGAATLNDRGTQAQMWQGTLAAAGSHTIHLEGTLPANMEINAVHTKILVTIFEVV